MPKRNNRIPVFTVPNSHVRVIPERKPEVNLKMLAQALLSHVEEQQPKRK